MKIYLWACLLGYLLAVGCSFTQKVKTGLQAYEVKQYAVAAQLFQEEYEASNNPTDKAKLAFLAGESFSKLNDQPNAGIWYSTAAKDGYGNEAKEKYAEALKRQEKYEEAIAVYDDLLKTSPGNAAYRSGITVCKQAMIGKKIRTSESKSHIPISIPLLQNIRHSPSPKEEYYLPAIVIRNTTLKPICGLAVLFPTSMFGINLPTRWKNLTTTLIHPKTTALPS
jgi:tetratricopeptide (TPR) repeat protein